MGSDEDIEQAARTSNQKGTRKVSDTRALIRYLMEHGHSSPFEMAELKFHICMPLFVEREWFTYRTASKNSVSTRYSVMPQNFYVPEKSVIGTQSKSNKQGRNYGALDDTLYEQSREEILNVHKTCSNGYKTLLKDGIARECAAPCMPLSLYTNFYWKIDLRNAFNVVNQRLRPNTRWECQEYARPLAVIIKELFPICWEAFDDFTLNSTTFSPKELNRLKYLMMIPGHHNIDYTTPKEEEKFSNKLNKEKIEVPSLDTLTTLTDLEVETLLYG